MATSTVRSSVKAALSAAWLCVQKLELPSIGTWAGQIQGVTALSAPAPATTPPPPMTADFKKRLRFMGTPFRLSTAPYLSPTRHCI